MGLRKTAGVRTSDPRAVAFLGFHDGTAGQIASWFEQVTGHRIACFVYESAEALRIDANTYRPTATIGKSTLIERAINKLRQNKFKTVYVIARNKVLTKIFEILKDGSELGVNGASPTPGTVSCMNCPALNFIGLSGFRQNVLIVGVSVITSSRRVSMG